MYFYNCFLHIGTEYVRSVENFQQELVNKVADFGADTILCSFHPHVARKLNFKGWRKRCFGELLPW